MRSSGGLWKFVVDEKESQFHTIRRDEAPYWWRGFFSCSPILWYWAANSSLQFQSQPNKRIREANSNSQFCAPILCIQTGCKQLHDRQTWTMVIPGHGGATTTRKKHHYSNRIQRKSLLGTRSTRDWNHVSKCQIIQVELVFSAHSGQSAVCVCIRFATSCAVGANMTDPEKVNGY
jgi:hypothetical protein